MTTSGPVDRRAALLTETDALADLVRAHDPATPIPTCPGWTLADLVTHIGRAQRWAAAMITHRATEALDTRAVPGGARPKEPEAAARWLSESARIATAAIDSAAPGATVWTTLGTSQPVQWWLRRLTNEVTVHRADAVLALGDTVAIDPFLAADAICEWLDLLGIALARREATALPDGSTLHLHATEPELGGAGEWTVRQNGTSVTWKHAHTKATVAVRGSAAGLLLTLMGRIEPGDPSLEIHGDPALLTRWLRLTPF